MSGHPSHDEREALGDYIAVRAPVGLRPRVQEVARAHGMTAAEFIRRAIEDRVLQLSGSASHSGSN
jgi:predicted DNA-binding protein